MTNEELAIIVQQKANKELTATLWENEKKILYKLSARYYRNCKDMFISRGIELEDLNQECYPVFIKAIEAYKPESGYKLTAYFNYQLQNKINILLGNGGHPIDALSMSESLDRPISDESSETTVLDTIKDQTIDIESDTCKSMAESYTAKILWREVDKLKPIQKEVIYSKYKYNKPTTVYATEKNIKYTTARHAENRALSLLKHNEEIIKLKELYGLESYRFYHISVGSFKSRGYSPLEDIVYKRLRAGHVNGIAS